jgi:sentrin-specific protease 7
MTHSTNPPRSEHSKLQRRNHQTPSLLRDRFQRTGPEEEVSDDELSYTLRKRSLSPAKRAKKAITAQEMPAQGYPLKFTRTETYESHGPELYITKGTNNSTFRVAAPLENGREDGFEFSFSQVVHALTDHVSRIRLVGPLISDGQRLHVDLQFLRITQLVRFEKEVARNITEKMLVGKPKEYMDTIFKKPLPGSRTKPLPPLRPHADDNDLPETTGPGLIDSLLASSASQRRAQPTANDVRVRNTGARHTDRPARSTRANPPTYAEDEVEDSSKPERYSEVHGLGAPWKHQLTYGSGRRRATVDFLDLERLDEGEFLNDQLIDFYLLYLFNLKPQLADKVYIFNTHFFSTLTRKVPGQKSAINYSAVARWTAKEDLFGYDYIVVPINQE